MDDATKPGLGVAREGHDLGRAIKQGKRVAL